MKTVIWFVVMSVAIFLISYNNPAFAATQTKRVCIQQVDPKTKKSREVCRQVKSHKKLTTTTKPAKKAK